MSYSTPPWLGNPKRENPKHETPHRVYTAHAVITTYKMTTKYTYAIDPLVDRTADEADYPTYYKGPNGAEVKVSHIEASIEMITVTSKPWKVRNKTKCVFGRLAQEGEKETVLTQHTCISMSYKDEKGEAFKVGADLHVVTGNSGRLWASNTKSFEGTNALATNRRVSGQERAFERTQICMSLLEFGNGMPFQALVIQREWDDFKGKDPEGRRLFRRALQFDTLGSSLPAEVLQHSTMQAVDQAMKDKRNHRAIYRGLWRTAYGSEGQRDALVDCFRRTMWDGNKEASKIGDESPQLLPETISKQTWGVFCEGMASISPLQPTRARRVWCISCFNGSDSAVGERAPWAPSWDEQGLKMGSKAAGGHGRPWKGTDWNPSMYSSAFNPLATAFVPGSDAASVCSLDSDLDIHHIMELAARPSAFDEEVYM
jgi:hypothetical protein